MTEIDDKLIKQFFTEQKQEIADNGFSRRVIRHLPNRELRLSNLLVTLCGIAAVILFFALNGLETIVEILCETFTSIANGATHLDLKSMAIAAVVLFFLAVRNLSVAE